MSLVYRGFSQRGSQPGAQDLAEGSRGEAFLGQKPSLGQTIENSATQFLEQAFDPAALAGMASAGAAFQGGRLLSARLAMKGLQNPGAIQTLGALGGFAVEVPAFVASSKGVNALMGRPVAWQGEAWAEEMKGAALILGALKLSGFSSAYLSRPLQSRYGFVRPVATQAGMFGGIYAGHHLEGQWLQGHAPDATTNFYQSLLTLFQFNVAGAMLPYVAPGLHHASQGLNLRTQGEIRRSQAQNQTPNLYAASPVLAGSVTGGRAEGLLPVMAMMGSNGPKKGNGPRGQLPHWLTKLPEEFFPDSRDSVGDPEGTQGGNRRVPQGVRESNQLAQLLDNLNHPKFRVRIKAIRELANQSSRVESESRWEIALALLEASTESITPVRKAAFKALPKVMENFENPEILSRFLEHVQDFATRTNVPQLQSLHDRQIQQMSGKPPRVAEIPQTRAKQLLAQLEAGPSKRTTRKLKQAVDIHHSLPDPLSRHHFAEALFQLGHRYETWRALGKVLDQLLEGMSPLERAWISFTSTLLRNPEPEAQIRGLLLQMTAEEFGVMDYNFRSELLRDAEGRDIPLRELPELLQTLDRMLSERRKVEQEKNIQDGSAETIKARFEAMVSVEDQGAFLAETFRQGKLEIFGEILQSLEPAYRSLVQREVAAHLTIPDEATLEVEISGMRPDYLARFEQEARKAFLYDGEGQLLPRDQVPLKVKRLFQAIEVRWSEFENDVMNGGSLLATAETAQHRDAQEASGARTHRDPVQEMEQRFSDLEESAQRENGRRLEDVRVQEKLDSLAKGFDGIERLEVTEIFERIDRYLDALEDDAPPVQETALKILKETFEYLEPEELEPAVSRLMLRIPQLKEQWEELDPMDRPEEISQKLDLFLEEIFFQELSGEQQGLLILNHLYERAISPEMDLRKAVMALETKFIDPLDTYLEAMPERHRSDSIYQILDVLRHRRQHAWFEIEAELRPKPVRELPELEEEPGEVEAFVREETSPQDPREMEEVLDSGEAQALDFSRSPVEVEVEKEVLGAFDRLSRPERRTEFVIWYFFNGQDAESTTEFLKIYGKLEGRLKPEERLEVQQRIAARMVLEKKDVLEGILISKSYEEVVAFRNRMLRWLQTDEVNLPSAPSEVREVMAPIQSAVQVLDFARTSAIHKVAYEDAHREPLTQDPMFLYGKTPEEQFARVSQFTQRSLIHHPRAWEVEVKGDQFRLKGNQNAGKIARYNSFASDLPLAEVTPPKFVSPLRSFVDAYPAILRAVEEPLGSAPRANGAPMASVVHRKEQIRQFREVVPGEPLEVKLERRVVGRSGEAQVLILSRQHLDAHGEAVAEARSILALGLDLSQATPKSLNPETLSEWGEPVLEVEVTEALIDEYTLKGEDPNPIHRDAKLAKRMGLPDRVLHGMATLKLAERALLARQPILKTLRPIAYDTNFESFVVPGDRLSFYVLAKDGFWEVQGVNQNGQKVLNLKVVEEGEAQDTGPAANSGAGSLKPLSPLKKNFGSLEGVEVDVQSGYDRVKAALGELDPVQLHRMSNLAERTAEQPWLIAGISDGIGFQTALALMASGMMRRGLGIYYEPEPFIDVRVPLYMKR
ncbi:MAG: MaoC family dehydratase, partial [bacterium]|nr:MaoC family dehydratase [bacterium]